MAAGAEAPNSVGVVVEYDGAVLDNTEITNGSSLPMVMLKEVGHTTGTLRYDAGVLGPGVSGTFALCTLHFKSVGEATDSVVDFTSTEVFGASGSPLSVSTEWAHVTVSGGVTPSPTPTQTTVPGDICVSVFADENGDEMRDLGEGLVAGAILTVTNSSRVVVDSYTTDGINEPHCFHVAAPGVYYLREQNPPGWASTSPDYWGLSIDEGVTWDIEIGDRLMDATPTPTATSSATPTPTATSTMTSTPTATVTATGEITATPTATLVPVRVSSSIVDPQNVDPLLPIMLYFDEPVVSDTVRIILYPETPFTTEWQEPDLMAAGVAGSTQVALYHDPFDRLTNYVLGVVAGQSESGASIEMTFWPFWVPGRTLMLPLSVK